MRQRAVKYDDALTRVEDHHTIGAVLQNGVQAVLLLRYALVELGVVDRNGGLIGEAGEYLAIVHRESGAIGAKHVQYPDQIPLDGHGKRHHLL